MNLSHQQQETNSGRSTYPPFLPLPLPRPFVSEIPSSAAYNIVSLGCWGGSLGPWSASVTGEMEDGAASLARKLGTLIRGRAGKAPEAWGSHHPACHKPLIITYILVAGVGVWGTSTVRFWPGVTTAVLSCSKCHSQWLTDHLFSPSYNLVKEGKLLS